MKSVLLSCFILFSGIAAKAQVCDTVYRAVHYPASYANDSLQQYIFRSITEVITQCRSEGEEPDAKLYLELTIDSTGKVADVHFRKPALSQRCEAMLRNKLMGIKGWKPALHNDQEVCSIFIIPVNCMKWQ
jgi:hypothetical protein